MPIELYGDNLHSCKMFSGQVVRTEVQTCQGLVVHGYHAALIDPGGTATFNRVLAQLGPHLKHLDYLLFSHQDPDTTGALEGWVLATRSKVVIPELWERSLPHLCAPGILDGRVITIPDAGLELPMGNYRLRALPAHFLHSEGNFHFHDPVARTLFSGDMGSAIGVEELCTPVESLGPHIRYMEPFHRRHMSCNKACRLWADMVREIDLEWLVPHHGPPLHGRGVIIDFLDWISELECGTDLLTAADYRPPGPVRHQGKGEGRREKREERREKGEG